MMLIRHHECTQDMEFRHLSSVHRLRRDQQQNQHQTEWNSQVEYNKRVEMELRKRHLFELKMQPKTLKVRRILTTGALRANQKLIGVPRGEQSALAWTASCHSQKSDRTLLLHVTFYAVRDIYTSEGRVCLMLMLVATMFGNLNRNLRMLSRRCVANSSTYPTAQVQ